MSQTMTMMEHQHHQYQGGPNIRSQDVRYRTTRIGGDQPYRDDPNAPVHLESFPTSGRGGGSLLGPASTPGTYSPMDPHAHAHAQHQPPMYFFNDELKGKQQQQFKQRQSVWQYCCAVSSTSSSLSNLENDGRYYMDDFNDLSWSCNVGTTDEQGIWLNQSDPAGTIMAMMVWILLGYSALTMTLLAETGGIPIYFSYFYNIICTLALACHVKTTLTDPGSVPPSAVPTEAQRKSDRLSMCSQCQTFKPPLSHHCRICNRCISRMDHHCPWMNNCVGAGNMKHFFLFLIYTWTCSAFSLLLLGWNYFFCVSEECAFNLVLTQLVRIMTVLSIGSFLFTSSMIMNVIYGLMTGIGTIDRLKKKATNTMHDSEEEPIPLIDVFGIGPWYSWPFPIDPIFEDYDRIMGFSTPQRLLREQILREHLLGGGGGGGGPPLLDDDISLTRPPSQMMIPPV